MDGEAKERDAMIDEGSLAAILGVSKRTLQNMRCRCEGPPFVKIGALVRYKLEDVQAYIAERRVQTASRPIGAGGLAGRRQVQLSQNRSKKAPHC